MQPQQPLGMLQRQTGGDAGAPVAALGEKPLISEPAHEFRPGVGDAMDVPTCFSGLSAESVSGQRWDDHMKAAAVVILKCRRIEKALHAVLELKERAGPAMSHDQRGRVRNG